MVEDIGALVVLVGEDSEIRIDFPVLDGPSPLFKLARNSSALKQAASN